MNYRPLTHSKTYIYQLGHLHFRATTVGELREFLAQIHPETPVLTTWEGTIHSLAHPELHADHDGEGPALVFDVEYDADEFSDRDGGALKLISSKNGPVDGQGMQE